MIRRTELDAEALRRLWREGLESGPGRNMSIEEIKAEARRDSSKEGLRGESRAK